MKDETLAELNAQLGTLSVVESPLIKSLFLQNIKLSDAVLNFAQLLKLDLPEREKILPWLPTGGLAMIAAERGLGKTHFALSLASALAAGRNFMKWPVLRSYSVLYVDGEMQLSDIRHRLSEFTNEQPKADLQILSHEIFYEKFERDLCVSDQIMQEHVLKLLEENKTDLLILDNLSSLTQIREDKADDWRTHMLPFLIACRRRGTAILAVHHCGKNGEQRGSNLKEDHLDTSIKLVRLEDDINFTGCRFKLIFTKSRGCYGKEVEPFIATLIQQGERAEWQMTCIEESLEDRIVKLLIKSGEEGITARDLADELKIHKGTVSKIKAKLEQEGVLQFSSGKKPLKLAVNWTGNTNNQRIK